MTITWHGLSCFELTFKSSAHAATLVMDPYDNATGLRFPRTLEANLVTVSHPAPDANNLSAVSGSPFVISGPGEYEVKDVFVYSTSAPVKDEKEKDIPNLIMRVESEEISLAHLGILNRPLTETELEGLQNIDILMLPVGGGRVLTPKMAAAVIEQVEPRVIIPMTYALPNLKEKLGAVEDFCKELRVFRKEEMNKYKVSRKDLPEEETVIVVLTR